MTPDSFKEKRDFIRMDMDTEFSFRIPGRNNIGMGHLKNLSHGGMQFITTEVLSPHMTIQVSIDLGHAKFKAMEAGLTIVRIDSLPEGRYLVAGTLHDIH